MVLVGYWPLNETEGDTAYDHSGNENHGDVDSGVDIGEPGILGETSFRFENDKDRVNVGQVLQSVNETSYTKTAWVKIDSGSNVTRVICAHDSSNDDGVRMEIKDDGQLQLTLSGITSVRPGFYPPSGEWVFLSVTHMLDDDKIIFRMNDNISTVAENSNPNNPSGFDYFIGDTDGRSSPFIGKIAEIRLYNRALTPSEVQHLYNVSKRGRFTSRKKKARKTE